MDILINYTRDETIEEAEGKFVPSPKVSSVGKIVTRVTIES